MLHRHVFGRISGEFRGISRVFVNFAGFRGYVWISRLRDCAKFRKPCNYSHRPYCQTPKKRWLVLPFKSYVVLVITTIMIITISTCTFHLLRHVYYCMMNLIWIRLMHITHLAYECCGSILSLVQFLFSFVLYSLSYITIHKLKQLQAYLKNKFSVKHSVWLSLFIKQHLL